MSVTYVDVVAEQAAATDTTLYTCPTGKKAVITFASATCEDASGSALTVNIVRSGGSVAVTNIHGYGNASGGAAISAGSCERLSKIEGAMMEAGGFLSVKAADASRLNLKFTIKEIA